VRLQLAKLGCDLGQGYLFSRPMSGDDVVAWAADRPLATV